MTAPVSSPAATPTEAERFFFDNNGYLVLENFLTPAHVARLCAALHAATTRRRAGVPPGHKAVWPPRVPADCTQIHGEKSARILNLLEDDLLLLELLTWPALLPYLRALLHPIPHYHASDAILEDAQDFMDRPPGWHIDGYGDAYRSLGRPIPLLQLKVGYYLSDMTQPWRGNLTVVPGSHKANREPTAEDLGRRDLFPGAVQVCAPAGTAILFHNAIWHTAAPYQQRGAGRTMLYYGYEQPWMLGNCAHWNYSKEFYNQKLTPEARKFFHGFVFDPPEQRMW